MQKSTQDIKKAESQEIYHMLRVAVVMGAARISIAIILAVYYSALYSLLDLIDSGNGFLITALVTPIKKKQKQPFFLFSG